MTRYRSIFMGTPEVAVPFLEALHQLTDVALVVSQPDRKRGRKQIVQATPVKTCAAALGIEVEQPERIRNNDAFRQRLLACRPDVILVVAYGRILPPAILNIPVAGCLNIHFSLLPAYRGAAPVNWALVNGETETGVTLMQMDEGMDTGPVVAVQRTGIDPMEQAPILFDRLTEMGVSLFNECLDDYMSGRLIPSEQVETGASLAPMMSRDDGRLSFHESAMALHNRVRGFQPWPGTRVTIDGNVLKILETGLPESGWNRPSGTVVVAGRKLLVQCGDGTSLPVLRLQPENRRPMDAGACINGGYVKDGDVWNES